MGGDLARYNKNIMHIIIGVAQISHLMTCVRFIQYLRLTIAKIAQKIAHKCANSHIKISLVLFLCMNLKEEIHLPTCTSFAGF